MSFSSEFKEQLWEKTRTQLFAPQKKNRMKPCCAKAFLTASTLFRPSPLPSDEIYEGLKRLQKEGFCDECDGLFLRAAFLHAGSVSDPQKRYHLEIRLPSEDAVRKLEESLNRRELPLKTVERKNTKVFYLKSSEDIEDFFTTVGSQAHALKLMETKVEKDFKNRINRLNNFDGANLHRTVYFAGRVADAIALLKQHDRFEQLPESLKKTAALRRKYPGASLSELCLYSEERLTKSGLNHRLQKIVEEAEKLAAELKKKEDSP